MDECNICIKISRNICMKIAITGGAGFIGSNIYEELYKDNHIIVFDNLRTGNAKNLPNDAILIKKDINDITAKDFAKVDIVFHCAALARVQPSIRNPIIYNNTNVNGTLKVLEAAKDAGVKKLIYSSSSSVYGNTTIFPTPETEKTNPLSPYALQKLIGEQYCKLYTDLYGLKTVILRYFNVYGENMPTKGAYRTVLGIFQDLKTQNKPLTITNNGDQRRDFTYIKDVVRANILAMQDNVGNAEIFNIGNGKNYSINDIAKAFGGPTEFIGNVVEPNQTLADNSKAKQELGWTTTKNIIEWITNEL